MSDQDSSPNLAESPDFRFTNRLIHETSPYLLQYAHNPVDWYPWGPDAFALAKSEDKPILLSVGYAACHWCHMQNHESFENERIAAIMNLNFVSIKVDREERPDIDGLYMDAVQALTGHGGWPMTVFLTPDGLPFYGGTYFPPEDRYGIPGFPTLLLRLAQFYKTRRPEVEEQAEEFRQFYAKRGSLAVPGLKQAPVAAEMDASVLDTAVRNLARSFDLTQGGFGGAPKFPHPMDLEFLLRMHLREDQTAAPLNRLASPRGSVPQQELTPLAMVTRTLDSMAGGGIYDHLGGGFHRYATDDRWLVPHFEKMLYDNAQLARVYLHAAQVTGKERYARVCRDILDYVRREMTSPEGGFYATQDADSAGEEGKFYVWTPDEISAVLDPADADLFMAVYGVTPEGNFEQTGATVLHSAKPAAEVAQQFGIPRDDAEHRLADARMALFAARQRRVWPGLDDKIITAWNGLMLRAFAEAAAAFDSETYAEVATHNAAFILSHLRDDQGRLLRTYRAGKAHIPAYLEDYACLIIGLLATYETTFDLRWFTEARALADQMIALFADPQDGGFFDTASDHEELVGRPREILDNATPCGNSVATEALLWLAALTGEHTYRARAEQLLLRLAPTMAQQPTGFGNFLCDLERWLAPSQEVAIIGSLLDTDTVDLLGVVRGRYRPNTVLACGTPGSSDAQAIPLLAQRPQLEDLPTAYVCVGFTCKQPVTDPAALEVQLGDG